MNVRELRCRCSSQKVVEKWCFVKIGSVPGEYQSYNRNINRIFCTFHPVLIKLITGHVYRPLLSDHELRNTRGIYSHKLKGETEFIFVRSTFIVLFG